MNKTLRIVIGLIFLNFGLMSQTTEYYTIEQAIQNKEIAESLFLNYNFQEVEPIPESIGELANLQEFRIFPKLFGFPKNAGGKGVSEEFDNSESKTPVTIPNGIVQCQNLRLIDISNSEIKSLPKGFGKLKNLEILVLNYSQIKLSDEIRKIEALINLKEIQLVGIEMNKEQRISLEKIPDLRILNTMEDLENQTSQDEEVDVQIHDTYMVFPNEEVANRFVNSMPNAMRELAKKHRKGNR